MTIFTETLLPMHICLLKKPKPHTHTISCQGYLY